jgi:hypothetical protein
MVTIKNFINFFPILFYVTPFIKESLSTRRHPTRLWFPLRILTLGQYTFLECLLFIILSYRYKWFINYLILYLFFLLYFLSE